MRRRLGTLAAVLPALALAGDAGAVRAPDGLVERPLEPAVGRGRQHVPTSWQVPAGARKAWDRLVAAHGSWQAIWDLDRGLPLRVFGEGIAAPGASADPAAALVAARRALAEQLALLAPTTTVGDWALVANVTHGRDGALRTVGFAQRHVGLPVIGGQLSFLFKRDRLIVMSSAAIPDLAVTVPGRLPAIDPAKAVAWIEGLYGATPTVRGTGALAVLPLVRERDDGQPRIEARLVRTVELDLRAPRARWDVYVDAVSGAPVARVQTLAFGAGTLYYDAPVRYPAGERQAYPAAQAGITVDGAAATTDAAGAVSFAGAGPADVLASVSGPLVQVSDNGAAGTTRTVAVADGGSGTWSAAAEPAVDAQVAAFVHAGRIKAFARAELAPQLAWLDGPLAVVVNEDTDDCNAYSTGDDLHFFVASSRCENTGRVADVVYHEFGHSLHAHAIVQGAGAREPHLSEGVSDYLAATTTGDPGMGRGFFVGDLAPVRHIDPDVGGEARYPDDMSDDPHVSGLIIAGALWDARKALVAQYGAAEGKRRADDLFYATIARASEIATAYPEILAADDDDGDLANGTPNQCLLARAFARHGLVDPATQLGLGPPTRDQLTVAVAAAAPAGGCPQPTVASAVVDWRRRGDATTQELAMAATAAGVTATLPAQADGAIVQYRVTVTLDDGARITFPQNAADPMYEFRAGALEPVYCTDFESDPFAAGWTHAATGGSSDWSWGAPAGTARNGDPAAAASGSRVVGMDLGGLARDGTYEPDVTTTLRSPVIDVNGRTDVRLVYRRWLSVEDGLFDRAAIEADGVEVWRNRASPAEPANLHHRDREWRVHEVDLSAQAADGTVQLGFVLAADGGLELGGWTIDDVCIMARPLEPCADGSCPDGDDGGCCSTGGGAPAGPVGLGLAVAAVLVRRRRRRAGTL